MRISLAALAVPLALVGLVHVTPAPAQEVMIQQRQQVTGAAPGQPGTPARDAQKAKEGTGGIKGRVFAADTNGPLRRARVMLSSPELRVNRGATTDAEGAFEFKKLPKGRYNLVASKGSYVSIAYGQRRPFERGRPLELADGQVVEKVNITLPRGCVITGRVTDDLGEPVAEVQVSAMRLLYWQGKRTPSPVGRMATTDDAGMYRIYGLPPGDYYIGTAFSPNRGMMMSDNEEGFVYAPTYYPGTPNMAESARVSVKVGQQRGNIDFTLVSSRTAAISGTALNSKGQPAVGASVSLGQTFGSPGGGFMSTIGGTSSNIQADGSFRVSGVAPGEYDLTLSYNNPETGEEESASTKVTVNGVDVIGVSLVVTPGAAMSGRVTTEDGGDLSFPTSELRVHTMTPDGSPSGFRMRSYMSGTVKGDGSFELKGLQGPRVFRVMGLPTGWMLKQVLYDGRDITDSGMEFEGTESYSGLQVVVTNRIPTVVGTVTDARGDTVREYTVVAFPEDPSLWTASSRYLLTSRPDQNGQFRLDKLPPAHYLVVALEYVEDGETNDPEFLNRLRDYATKFTLGEAESRSLSLKLTTLPQ